MRKFEKQSAFAIQEAVIQSLNRKKANTLVNLLELRSEDETDASDDCPPAKTALLNISLRAVLPEIRRQAFRAISEKLSLGALAGIRKLASEQQSMEAHIPEIERVIALRIKYEEDY
jgi:hypothetical protein